MAKTEEPRGVDTLDVSQLTEKQKNLIRRARWRCRYDLIYLAREVLGKPDVSEEFNGVLVNRLQQFPKPNEEQFTKNDLWTPTGWNYTPILPDMLDLPGKRDRLIIDFRSSFKTTLNCEAHTIQWLINYPLVCVGIFQFNLEKAESIIGAIKSHFCFNDRFRALFPELCPPIEKIGNFGTQTEFDLWGTDKRRSTSRRESSVMAGALSAGLAGYHFEVMKFSDIVEPKNTQNTDQCQKTIAEFGQAKYLRVSDAYWRDVEGTRYAFCLDGKTLITTEAWKQKPIEDIQVGDFVVGWDFDNLHGLKRGNKRFLKKSKVLAKGVLTAKTNKYTFASGRYIICTPEHKFWRGKQWKKNSKNREYSDIKSLKSVRRIFIPVEQEQSWQAGWLAGFFDGEGTVGKNPNHPSGHIHITQTMHNPMLIEKTREVLKALGFTWTESWLSLEPPNSDRCVFNITGGWTERYRFLAQISPERSEKIIETLYAQLFTEEDRIVKTEPLGEQDVYWIQTETGNYIADGCCSKNSDLYGKLAEDWIKEVKSGKEPSWEVYCRSVFRPNKDNPQFTPDELALPDKLDEDGKPVTWWTQDKKRFDVDRLLADEADDPTNFSAQMRNRPIGGRGGSLDFPVVKDGETYTLPATISNDEFSKLNIAYSLISVDAAYTVNEHSNASAFVIADVDRTGRIYVKQIVNEKLESKDVSRMIIRLCDRYKPHYLMLEDINFSRGLSVGLEREWDLFPLLHHKPVIRWTKRTNLKAKEEVIRLTLSYYYHQKELRFVKDLISPSSWESLLVELRTFPRGISDNILDALTDMFYDKHWHGREMPFPQMEVNPNLKPEDLINFGPPSKTAMDAHLMGALGLTNALNSPREPSAFNILTPDELLQRYSP